MKNKLVRWLLNAEQAKSVSVWHRVCRCKIVKKIFFDFSSLWAEGNLEKKGVLLNEVHRDKWATVADKNSLWCVKVTRVMRNSVRAKIPPSPHAWNWVSKIDPAHQQVLSVPTCKISIPIPFVPRITESFFSSPKNNALRPFSLKNEHAKQLEFWPRPQNWCAEQLLPRRDFSSFFSNHAANRKHLLGCDMRRRRSKFSRFFYQICPPRARFNARFSCIFFVFFVFGFQSLVATRTCKCTCVFPPTLEGTVSIHASTSCLHAWWMLNRQRVFITDPPPRLHMYASTCIC